MIVKRLFRALGTVAAVALLAGMSTSARADGSQLFFTGGPGEDWYATALFVASGDTLTVTLTNDWSSDVLLPTQVLTGVFFDTTAGLTPVSALLNTGSTVVFGSDGGGNVGGEFAYGSGLSGAPGGATKGISSAGLGLFGNPNFGGTSLDPPTGVDGLNYGITSAGDNTGTGNAEVTGNVPLIKNSVVFTLTGLPTGFDPSTGITNVWFQYGTALTDPHHRFTPEPAFYQMAGFLSLGGLGLLKLRRRRKV